MVGLFLTRAARRGHENIVRLMLSQGVNNYNDAMAMAALNGRESIVRLMLNHGATNYNQALDVAASAGHQNIVELIQERMNSPSS